MSHRRSDPTRTAFTAIELVVTVSLLLTLITLSAVSLLPALRSGHLSEAVNRIDNCAQTARQLARLRGGAGSALYGVAIVGNVSPNYVTVLYGTTEMRRFPLNANLQLFRGGSPASGSITWYNQPLTGYLVDAGGNLVDVGAVPQGDPAHVSLRTLDGRMKMAIALYRVGLLSMERF